MKKFFSVILAVSMILSLIAFTGCESEETSGLKFGMGVLAYYGDAISADGESDGSAEAYATVAALLADEEGKIVKVAFDSLDVAGYYTADGKAAVTPGEFPTKREFGDSYGMVTWGGASLEWYLQVDALEGYLVGKTLDEAKAIVVDGYKGNDDVISAGCTIGISDFILAIEKAFANLKASKGAASDTLDIGIVTSVEETVDATDENNGQHTFAVSVAAAAVNSEGRVTACATDAFDVTMAFDKAGQAIENDSKIKTKYEQGADYGMAKYGQDLNGDGIVKEWFEQADSFCEICIQLNSSEISALAVNDGKEFVQVVGCTIDANDMISAMTKATK